MVELPRRELPVRPRTSLAGWLPVVLAGALALALGVAGGLHGARALLAAVGLIALAAAGVALVRPPTLVVDADGLALRTPLGERWRQRWSDCGEFRTWRGDVVVWTAAPEAARHPRSAATWRRRADADTGLVAQFGGLSATDLAALLNRYRGAALRA
ncbi:MAG TPA: hypothetical protein VI248_17310 [Kineosporiaceae bacterium]